MAVQYTGTVPPPPFISMSGGINKNIYNPNAPAKIRERKHSQNLRRRRAETFNPRSPAKMRERAQNQKARKRRNAYRGTPPLPRETAPKDQQLSGMQKPPAAHNWGT